MQPKTLLPCASQTKLMKALELSTRKIEELPTNTIKNFWNPNKCPAELLPYLAFQLGADFWSANMPISYQRQICQNALLINKYRGTIGALKLAISSLNLGLELQEWFQYNGEAGTGKANINLGENPFSAETYALIVSIVYKVKRLSFNLSITTQNAFNATLPYIAGGVMNGEITNIIME